MVQHTHAMVFLFVEDPIHYRFCVFVWYPHRLLGGCPQNDFPLDFMLRFVSFLSKNVPGSSATFMAHGQCP